MSDQSVAAGHAMMASGLPPEATAELTRVAARLRRGSGVLVRVADLMGGAVGQSFRLGVRGIGLAPDIQAKVRGLAAAAVARAFDLAVLRLKSPRKPGFFSQEGARTVVVLSGAVGGFLGLGGFLPDVTVTTFAIMRAIARIAQEEGEDLADEDTRRACLQVFALTPQHGSKAESDIGYYSARLLMQGRPLTMLLTEVAAQYGVSISQKLALQTMPFVGAAGGAALNAAFFRHYQDAARAHFVIRRLERSFGAAAVSNTWAVLSEGRGA